MMQNKSSTTNGLGLRLKARFGEWAVVTGASDGIGRAVATDLAREGVNLVLVARRGSLLESLARELTRDFGIEARTCVADLAEEVGRDRVIESANGLDVGILVNAAGFGTSGDFFEQSLEAELSMIEVNCTAVVRLTHEFGKRFVERGKGVILLYSSIVAFQGVPRAACYSATKAFIQNFGEGLREEISSKGVQVVICAPGPVRTGFADRARMMMGAALRPEEVARSSLQSIGRGGTLLPGFLSKILEFGLMFAFFRRGRVQIMKRVMHGMTKHQVT